MEKVTLHFSGYFMEVPSDRVTAYLARGWTLADDPPPDPAGVREPRRQPPNAPVGSMALEIPRDVLS